MLKNVGIFLLCHFSCIIQMYSALSKPSKKMLQDTGFSTVWGGGVYTFKECIPLRYTLENMVKIPQKTVKNYLK